MWTITVHGDPKPKGSLRHMCELCGGSGTAFAYLLGETEPDDFHEYACPLCACPYPRGKTVR